MTFIWTNIVGDRTQGIGIQGQMLTLGGVGRGILVRADAGGGQNYGKHAYVIRERLHHVTYLFYLV